MNGMRRALRLVIVLSICTLVVIWSGMLLLLLSEMISRVSHAEEPLRVAVIDTGLNVGDPRFKARLCPSGHLDLTHRALNDTDGHGTHVTGLITKYAGNANYCLMIIKYFDIKAAPHQNRSAADKAFDWAVGMGAKLINYSSSGTGYDELESRIIQFHPDVTFVVAAGNNNHNVTEPGQMYYPAALPFPNIVVVGDGTSPVDRDVSSNFGPKVNVWVDGRNVESTMPGGKVGRMTGTSMSCAIRTGQLINKLAGARTDFSESKSSEQ